MIQLAPGHILDEFGNPIRTKAKARKELTEAFAEFQAKKRREVRGTYDAARTTPEFKNYWANTDSFDADSANNREVRHELIRRSRYEIGSNGYADGIAVTYCNDLVGTGPNLRMDTGSENFNRMIEREWQAWCRAVGFRRKLWCMAHAKHQDGESFGVLRRNNNIRHRVNLDLVLVEAEMCQTPMLPGERNYIDGIKFDEFGNPLWYDILRDHPGGSYPFGRDIEPERIDARLVMHWFKMRRPGQHRGIPEMTSTMNIGAAARRWREAVIAAAENIADFSLFIKTTFQPDDMEAVEPMSTADIQKRMMTALPEGYDAFQPKAEQPTATHAEFNKSLISEQARPKNMPLNKAMCDSSSYNYASGRLDHATYYGSLNIDRQDCDEMVLDRLFRVWFEIAIIRFGWLGGDPIVADTAAAAHYWDWPKHHVADIESESNSVAKDLQSGKTTLHRVYANDGLDYEDEIIDEATACGVSVDEMRKISMLRNIPQHVIPFVVQLLETGSMTAPQAQPPQLQPAGAEDES